jgi:hypothetical protein
MTSRELLQMAIDALTNGEHITENQWECAVLIRAHLSPPEPEPKAWIKKHIRDLPQDKHLYIETSRQDIDRWLSQYKDGFAWVEPLFTRDQL